MQGKKLKYCKDQPKKPERGELKRHRSSEKLPRENHKPEKRPKKEGEERGGEEGGKAGAGRNQRDPNLKGTSSAESEAIEAYQTEKIKTDCSDQNAFRSI